MESSLVDAGPATQTLTELAADLARGTVDTLVLVGVNPVYDGPADLEPRDPTDPALPGEVDAGLIGGNSTGFFTQPASGEFTAR